MCQASRDIDMQQTIFSLWPLLVLSLERSYNSNAELRYTLLLIKNFCACVSQSTRGEGKGYLRMPA